MITIKIFITGLFLIFMSGSQSGNCIAQLSAKSKNNSANDELWKTIDILCLKEADKVIAWRRDFHRNPELGNREFRTAKKIAEHLRELGIQVQTGVAHTGVVGIMKGKYDGPIVALRADIDALPIKELADIPFASKVTAGYNGQQVHVMHACGHDAHAAILMGVAEVLSQIKDELHGTIKFIFQPAEDSKPDGEEGGADLMIKEGVLENPVPDVIFGLHVAPYPSATLSYRTGGIFAAVDNFSITVKGAQTHGALPWTGTDAITVSAQIITGLQTIISRQIDLTEAPAIISIGTINGGIQQNIVSGEVEMKGTIRTFSISMQKDIQERIKRTAENIAESAGAKTDVSFYTGVPVVYNDPDLTAKMSATLNTVAKNSGIFMTRPITVGDDFSSYTQKIPGFYFLLGVAPEGENPAKIINHSPYFIIDEKALIKGVEAITHLTVDYLNGN